MHRAWKCVVPRSGPGRRNLSHPLGTSPSAAGAGAENDSQSPQSVCQRLPVKRPSSEVPQQLQPSTRRGPHGRGKSHIASRRRDVSTLYPDAPPCPPQLLQGDVACRSRAQADPWDTTVVKPRGWGSGRRPQPLKPESSAPRSAAEILTGETERGRCRGGPRAEDGVGRLRAQLSGRSRSS